MFFCRQTVSVVYCRPEIGLKLTIIVIIDDQETTFTMIPIIVEFIKCLK